MAIHSPIHFFKKKNMNTLACIVIAIEAVALLAWIFNLQESWWTYPKKKKKSALAGLLQAAYCNWQLFTPVPVISYKLATSVHSAVNLLTDLAFLLFWIIFNNLLYIHHTADIWGPSLSGHTNILVQKLDPSFSSHSGEKECKRYISLPTMFFILLHFS